MCFRSRANDSPSQSGKRKYSGSTLGQGGDSTTKRHQIEKNVTGGKDDTLVGEGRLG
ncbi:hypothetical protein VF21_10398, partial [Pseudogymnoascus sp. 05NY08]